MVDVHPPDFFCPGSSLKTPPVIGASAEMGASAQGRELKNRALSPIEIGAASASR